MSVTRTSTSLASKREITKALIQEVTKYEPKTDSWKISLNTESLLV